MFLIYQESKNTVLPDYCIKLEGSVLAGSCEKVLGRLLAKTEDDQVVIDNKEASSGAYSHWVRIPFLVDTGTSFETPPVFQLCSTNSVQLIYYTLAIKLE